MERAIITISENGKVNIPSGNIWMSEMELVVLFGTVTPNNTTLTIYNSDGLRIHIKDYKFLLNDSHHRFCLIITSL